MRRASATCDLHSSPAMRVELATAINLRFPWNVMLWIEREPSFVEAQAVVEGVIRRACCPSCTLCTGLWKSVPDLTRRVDGDVDDSSSLSETAVT